MQTAEALIRYGALIVKDSRVSEDANSRFLDVMEDYFDQDEEALKADARPEYHFQVGVTLENTEKVSANRAPRRWFVRQLHHFPFAAQMPLLRLLQGHYLFS